LAQTQLPEIARRVLEVDEKRFKGLARMALLMPYHIRADRLATTEIVLGRVNPGEREYRAVVEVPLCHERYGNSHGIFYARVEFCKPAWWSGIWSYLFFLGYQCMVARTSEPAKKGSRFCLRQRYCCRSIGIIQAL